MSTAGLNPTTTHVPITAEQLFRDYKGSRCELIDGKVRMMSPAGFGHGAIAQKIATLLSRHVAEHDLGEVAAAETGFLLPGSPETVIAPDAAFVRKERLAEIGYPENYFPEAPALAVEVTSPDDTADHVEDKARRWLAAGAQMVWVVYPRGRSVTVYRSLDDVRVLTENATLDASDVIQGFSCPIGKFFEGLK